MLPGAKIQYIEAHNMGVHQQLVGHFVSSKDSRRQDIGRDLKTLLRYRRAVDYDDFIAPSLLARNTATSL